MATWIRKSAFAVGLLFCTTAVADKPHFPIVISAMIIDITHPRVLYSNHPNLRLTPASTSKLFVATAALRQLGSNYHFTTPIYANGRFSQGILQGDLILYGVGDPMLTNEKLWALTNQLQQLGLTKITGDLIINTSYLGAVIPNDPDRIQAKISTDLAYNGLLSSAGSDFGTIGVNIFPAQQDGLMARESIVPFNLSAVTLSGKVMTGDNQNTPLTLIRTNTEGHENLTVSGSIKKDAEPVILYRAVANPDLLTGNLLKGFFSEAGIHLMGSVIVRNTALSKKDKLLISFDSEPLSMLLQTMLHTSSNYMADTLTLDLWRNQQSILPAQTDLAIAAQNLLTEYQKIAHTSSFYDAKVGLPVLYSGSGLTPNNKVSAHDFIVLLDGFYHDTSNFPILHGALTNFGAASHWRKELKSAQFQWANRLMAKTGSMVHPVPALGLAGYFRLKNGDQAAFALLMNQPGGDSIDEGAFPVEFIHQLDHLFTTF